jgi:hypothetical protein
MALNPLFSRDKTIFYAFCIGLFQQSEALRRFFICHPFHKVFNLSSCYTFMRESYDGGERYQMKINIKSFVWTVIFAGLFFGLLVGLQFGIKSLLVDDRFEKQLATVSGIEDITIDQEQVINIQVSKVENIKTVYKEVDQIIKNKGYTVNIISNSTEKLDRLGEKCEIVIEEAMVRGNFIEMETYVGQLAQDNQAEADVFIDKNRVYLQLRSGSNYLYRVINRPQTVQEMANQTT